MSKVINVELEKEMYDDVKTLVSFKNVVMENDIVNADVDEIQYNIALHQSGWSQSDDLECIYKVFEETIAQLDKFRTLLDDSYVRAILPELDIEMFIHDAENLRMDIRDNTYLFEF